MGLGGKIDAGGVLYIDRAGRLMEQLCPYSNFGAQHNCSHFCPMFGEPIRRQDGRTILSLCGKFAIVFDRFLDERQTPEENLV